MIGVAVAAADKQWFPDEELGEPELIHRREDQGDPAASRPPNTRPYPRTASTLFWREFHALRRTFGLIWGK